MTHIKFPIKEQPGINHYAIFVSGTGPQYQVPYGDLAGYIILDINIAENENLHSSKEINNFSMAEGQIDDESLLMECNFLLKAE